MAVTELLLYFSCKGSSFRHEGWQKGKESMQMSNSKCYLYSTAAAMLLAILTNAPLARATDGDLDPTFGVGGKVLTDLNHSTDLANGVAIQSDGKLVVVGQTYTNNDFSTEDFAVARYNTNGTLDTTFGVGGKVTTDFPGLAAVAFSVVIQ